MSPSHKCQDCGAPCAAHKAVCFNCWSAKGFIGHGVGYGEGHEAEHEAAKASLREKNGGTERPSGQGPSAPPMGAETQHNPTQRERALQVRVQRLQTALQEEQQVLSGIVRKVAALLWHRRDLFAQDTPLVQSPDNEHP